MKEFEVWTENQKIVANTIRKYCIENTKSSPDTMMNNTTRSMEHY